FSITSGIRFFEQAHIKDATAYLKVATNPRDELAFKRIVQLLPGVGGKGAEKLWQKFNSALKPAGAEAGPGAATPVATAAQTCAEAVPKKTAVAWAQLVATLSQLETAPARGNPAKMLRLVVEAGYEEHLQENYANFRNRLDDLEQLAI